MVRAKPGEDRSPATGGACPVAGIVIALVVLAMLRPTLIYTQTKKQAATLVVLADQSRSMSVPDAVGNKTRWQAVARDTEKCRARRWPSCSATSS